MKVTHFLTSLAALILVLSSGNGLNFYTAEVAPPNAPYTQILSGNDVFSIVYSTFNNTGLMLLGGALLISTGIFALPFLPTPDELEDSIHKFRNGPLGFIPKPGFGNKNKGKKKEEANDYATTPTSKPVTYSLDLDEFDAQNNYISRNFDGQQSNYNLGGVPGPPYGEATTNQPKKKEKQQIFIHVEHPKNGGQISTTSNFEADHKVSQVIEPVVNTITDAIKQTLKKYDSFQDRIDHHQQADRRMTPTLTTRNSQNYVDSNDVNYDDDLFEHQYGFPLDYYSYEVPTTTKRPQLPKRQLERLRELKKAYQVPPQQSRFYKRKSEPSYDHSRYYL